MYDAFGKKITLLFLTFKLNFFYDSVGKCFLFQS